MTISTRVFGAVVIPVALLLAAMAPAVRAGTSSWALSADGTWDAAGNWTGGLPGPTNTVSILQGGSYTVSVTNSTANDFPGMLDIASMTLGNSADDAPRVLVSYTNTSAVLHMTNFLTMGTGGNAGVLDIAAGAVQVDGTVRLGASAASSDLLLIRGGSFSTTNAFQVAYNAGSTSSVIVAQGGSLYLTNRGGNATGNYVGLAPQSSGSYGSLLVSGGVVRLQNKAGESNTYFYVARGAGGRGEMFIYDGSVDINGAYMTIGGNAGSTGLVVVSGGSLTVTNENSIGGYFRVGASGVATLVVSNNGYVASDRLAIAYGAGGMGYVLISDGGVLEMTGANYLKAGILGGTGFFTNRNGGTLRFTINSPDLQFTNPGIIQNAAIEFKGVSAADVAGAQLAKFAYSGTNTLRLSSATNAALSSFLLGTTTNFAILDLVSNSAFRATSFTIGSSGKAIGTGSILANNATNVGTLAPGHSAGVLTFSNNLVLAAASTLNIELGGTNSMDYDRLIANGLLTVGGTLNVTLINGYTPTAGDAVDILDWGSIFGTFSAVNLPSAEWSAANLYTDGTLLYAAVPEPGLVSLVGLGLAALVLARRSRRG
jgi:T5SS/PEP-CTERM-associated repeat protein